MSDIRQFPPIKAERHIEKAQEWATKLAVSRAETDYKAKKVHNGYRSGTVEHEAYGTRLAELRGLE